MPTTVIPHLHTRNAAEAVDFYAKAFGAKITGKFCTPDGRVMHSALSFEGAMVFVCDEFPEHGGTSPQALNGSPVTIHLQVSDADAIFNQAVAAGCKVKMPLDDMFWGDRYGCVSDPYGHEWSFGTTIREVPPEELQAIISSFGDQACGADAK